MATIYDIARAANVSHTTVSRVINSSGYVSDKTRQRVLDVIDEFGYYPNDLARGLTQKATRTTAVIIPDVTNPFFTTVVRGVEDVARRNGFSVILCNTDDTMEHESMYIDLVLRKQIDGVLLASAAKDGRHLASLVKACVPLVLLDRRLQGVECDTVRADSYGGAQKGTRFLLDQGHTRVALVSGPLYLDSMNERYRGYCDSLTAAQLPIDPKLIAAGETHFQSGVKLCKTLLQYDNPPTAFLCTNNFLGLGVYTGLKESGKRIPDDASLVVFDDVEEYSQAFPVITTITQPSYSFGTMAMELLLHRIRGENKRAAEEIVLPTELIPRATTV